MDNKFDFYEVVVIDATVDPGLRKVHGESGIVLGMASHEGIWGYAVQVISTEEVWDAIEPALSSTGRFVSRSDIYKGESIRVRVNPVTGEGEETFPHNRIAE